MSPKFTYIIICLDGTNTNELGFIFFPTSPLYNLGIYLVDKCFSYLIIISFPYLCVFFGSCKREAHPSDAAAHRHTRTGVHRRRPGEPLEATVCVHLISNDVFLYITSEQTTCLYYQEYESKGQRPLMMSPGAAHSGVHVLVVHESGGHLMMAHHFRTHQPAEHQRLRQCLSNVQPGRVMAVLGAVSTTLGNRGK